MGPKKRKKMTEEEKRAFEELKRLEMEEARKKKEELVTQLMKDRLSLEEQSRRFSHSKLVHQWRRMMREARTKELKKDIEAKSQTFERTIDRHDSTVKNLLKELADADEQYAMVFRSHLQNIDFLIDLQKRRLQTLKDDFQAEQETVREEFDSERTMTCEFHNKDMNDMADILFAIEERFQEREADAKDKFMSMRDELKNKDLEEKHALRVNLEQKVDELWQQFRQALQNYNETTEERKTSFEALKLKDEKSASEIDLQMRKLQRISDRIGYLRSRMATNARDSEEKNKYLKEARERMANRFQEMKRQVNGVRAAQRERLTKLTLESNAALKELRRQINKGGQILRVAEMCRKTETEEEKVVPFYASSLTAQQLEDVHDAVLEPPVEPLASVMRDYVGLEHFWQRYNKVLLEQLALQKKKQVLQHHNSRLRSLLKDYLDGVSVNQEVLSKQNTLVVVSSKNSKKAEALRDKLTANDPRVLRAMEGSGNKIIIEAAHIVNNILP